LVSKTFTEVIMVTFSSQTLLFFACGTYAFYNTMRPAPAGPRQSYSGDARRAPAPA
jgi:hypothetical protein